MERNPLSTPNRTRFPSRVAISDENRVRLVETCNVALGSTLDLASQVKQAHWNIKGPQFFARHQLFDEIATHLREHADNLAERAATLGGYAEGTARLAIERSVLPEYDLDAVDGRQHIRTLAERYGKYAKMMRDSIDVAKSVDDAATEDLFTEVLRATELDMWFLESHVSV